MKIYEHLDKRVVVSRIGLSAVDDHPHQVVVVADPPQVGRVQLQTRPQLGLEMLSVLLFTMWTPK